MFVRETVFDAVASGQFVFVPDSHQFFNLLGGRGHHRTDLLVEADTEGNPRSLGDGDNGCVHLGCRAGKGGVWQLNHQQALDLALLELGFFSMNGGLDKKSADQKGENERCF